MGKDKDPNAKIEKEKAKEEAKKAKEEHKKEKEREKEKEKEAKEREKEAKEKEKQDKKQNRKSLTKSVAPSSIAPVQPTLTTSPSKLPPSNSGYSKDLDLEERVFKPWVAQRQQKEDVCFFVLLRMVTPSKAKKGKYAFLDKDCSLPVYVLFTTKNLYILDASAFKLTQTIPITDIREVIIEVTENGQITLEQNNNTHVYFLSSCDPFLLNDMLELFHRGAKLAQDSRPQPPFFVSQRTTFVQSYIERSNLNQFVVKKIVQEIEELGFTDQDVWGGCVDMRPWIKKYISLAQPDVTTAYVIEFILPSGGKSYYKFAEHVTIKKVIQTASLGAKLPAEKLALAPVNGSELIEDATLGSYGLGILFDTWQLLVIEKGTRKQYDVSIELPDTPEFQSFGNKVYKTKFSAHLTGKEAVETVCLAVRVPRPHRFGLTFVDRQKRNSMKPPASADDEDDTIGGVVEANHPLSAHGFCGKHTNLRLVYQFFPIATGDKPRDAKLVRSVISDFVEDAFIIVKERKKRKMGEYLSEMIRGLADTMVSEYYKAKTLTTRVAALNNNSKNQLYRMLDEYETEEVALFGIAGQRRLMERARDFLYTNLPPAPPATSAPKPAPIPPILPPKPPPMQVKGATITKIIEVIDKDGNKIRIEKKVTLGGGWGGPPSMLDLLGARKRLRPVETSGSGWDKSGANIGMDIRKISTAGNQLPRESYEIPSEAIELYLKLKRRQEAIEKSMVVAAVDDVEDLGD